MALTARRRFDGLGAARLEQAGLEFLARIFTSLRSDVVLDALEQSLYGRPLAPAQPLVHHSDRGHAQDLSIRHTERLA